MPSEAVSFENDRGQTLSGLIDGAGDRCVVLCSHFTGFKEVGHLHRAARSFADAGLSALRFDYADCIGDSEGACDEMSVTHQVRDTLAAVRALVDRGVEQVGLWGHSLGGLTAIVAAAEASQVDALVSVAAPAKLEWETLFRERCETWREQGYVTFDTWKRGEIRLPWAFYEDLKRYDATELVTRIEVPILVVHAGEDALIALKNAEGIHAAANDPKELVVVDGADHLFQDRELEAEMIEASVGWFERWLA